MNCGPGVASRSSAPERFCPAREVLHPARESLDLVDITIERNAYGRQFYSCVTAVEVDGEAMEAVERKVIRTVRNRGSALRAETTE